MNILRIILVSVHCRDVKCGVVRGCGCVCVCGVGAGGGREDTDTAADLKVVRV